MIEELVYTSATRGLKAGSRGFCTVASTAGMAGPLASLLESLSGYRHLAPPGSTGSDQNPIVFSHLQCRLGGRTLHILSRIADAGMDYSGRSNKLAHHIVLADGELKTLNPAWVQGQPGCHQTSWSGEPRILTSGQSLPQGDSLPGICNYWSSVTGDAGWGGVLAETFAREGSPDTWVIYQAGTDARRLLEESIALLPVGLRKRATYSTFFTRLPPGINCRVRFVPDGTPEALQLRKRYELHVLDLCGGLGSAPESDWTTVARTGEMARRVAPVGPSDRHGVVQNTCESGLSVTDRELALARETPGLPPPLPGRHVATPDRTKRMRFAVDNGRRERRASWQFAAALLALAATVMISVIVLTNSALRERLMGILSLGPQEVNAENDKPDGGNPPDSPEQKENTKQPDDSKSATSSSTAVGQPSPPTKPPSTDAPPADEECDSTSGEGNGQTGEPPPSAEKSEPLTLVATLPKANGTSTIDLSPAHFDTISDAIWYYPDLPVGPQAARQLPIQLVRNDNTWKAMTSDPSRKPDKKPKPDLRLLEFTWNAPQITLTGLPLGAQPPAADTLLRSMLVIRGKTKGDKENETRIVFASPEVLSSHPDWPQNVSVKDVLTSWDKYSPTIAVPQAGDNKLTWTLTLNGKPVVLGAPKLIHTVDGLEICATVSENDDKKQITMHLGPRLTPTESPVTFMSLQQPLETYIKFGALCKELGVPQSTDECNRKLIDPDFHNDNKEKLKERWKAIHDALENSPIPKDLEGLDAKKVCDELRHFQCHWTVTYRAKAFVNGKYVDSEEIVYATTAIELPIPAVAP